MIEIIYTNSQFIGPMLRQDIFDEYLVFKKDGIIEETFNSGISKLVQDSLKNEKSAFGKNSVKDLTISGTQYKLFSHLIKLGAGCEITIAGLLSKTHYDDEKNKLPTPLTIGILLIAIFSVLLLPWLKLYQIGNQDRLTATDGILCLAVPMLLTSVLFFTFLQYYIGMQEGTKGFYKGATYVSESINIRLMNEIKQTYGFLRAADIAVNTDAAAHERAGFPGPINKIRNHADSTIRISQVFRLGNDGKEIQNWSQTGATPPLDYSKRAYFTKLRDNKPYYLSYLYDQRYTLEPVISRTTGTFKTVMCIKSFAAPGTYTAVSFELRSLSATILTPGFQFAVINDDGRVLYHSDPAKQLNENLFKEFSKCDELSAAVHARRQKSFNTNYSGKDYSAYTAPVNGLPFTIIILEDFTLTKTRMNDQFYFSFKMLFGYFLILALELTLVFAASVKSAYYKKHYFDVSWLGPDSRFREAYNLTFYGNLMIILILPLAWLFKPGFLEFLFIFLTAANLSYIFQHGIYALYYYQIKDSRLNLKRRGIEVMTVLLLLTDVIACFLCSVLYLFLFQLLLILGLGALIWRTMSKADVAQKKKLIKKISALTALFNKCRAFLAWSAFWPNNAAVTRRRENEKYIVGFTLMTFSRLIITSGLPVIFFFLAIYNYDLKLMSRYRQNGFINQLASRGVHSIGDLNGITIYQDGVWVNSYHLGRIIAPGDQQGAGAATAISIFHCLIPRNDGLLPDISGLDFAPVDSSRVYSDIFDTGKGTSWYRLPDGQALTASSIVLRYNIPWPLSSSKGFLFWIFILSWLSGFCLLFYNVIRRVFALTLPTDNGWPTIDQVILQTSSLNKLLFLIGTPGSGKLTHVKDLIDNKVLTGDQGEQLAYEKLAHMDANCFIADMILIPNGDGADTGIDDWLAMKIKTMDKKYKLIIINQFEYDIKNPTSNRAKLTLLEDLLQNNAAKVIIISTVHPVNFLDSLNQQQSIEAPQSAPYGTSPYVPGSNASPEHDLERWHVLLGHFKIVIQPLTNLAPALCDIRSTDLALRYETRSGIILNDLYQPLHHIKKRLQDESVTAESLTLKLAITAHYFYMYIWQSLTKEEKFILYDLAEDGIVNPFDDYNLILLISKGLIIRQNGQLHLFNQGFREFIMTAIGQSEAMLIQKEIKDNGNWNKLKTPLVLLIMALLVFLFTSQKEIYTDLLKYVAIITGGVPLVMQLFSLAKSNTNLNIK